MDNLKTYVIIQLTKYFDQALLMDYVESRIKTFAHIFSPNCEDHPLYCPINLDINDLNNYDARVMDLLNKEPDFVHECVLEIIERCVSIEIGIKVQICAPIILTSIPRNDFFDKSKGLRSMQGVVSEETFSEKYILTSKWKCGEDICKNLDVIVVKNHPKQICYHCARPMNEIVLSRTIGNCRKIKLISLNNGVSKNSKPFFFDEDSGIYKDIRLGDEIQVIYMERKSHLEAWGCTRMDQIIQALQKGSRIEVMRRNSENPFSFVQALARTIGYQYLPFDFLINFRMFILLSLASTGDEFPISILAVGRDTSTASQLFKYALESAYTKFVGGSNCDLSGYVIGNSKQAGAMILASNGVCYLGNWNIYSKKQKTEVCGAVESGEVKLLNSPKVSIPLRSAIWTYLDEPRNKKDTFEFDTVKQSFGLALRTDETDEKEEALIKLILEEKRRFDSYISLKELKTYLHSIIHIKVQLLDTTTEEIKKYFVCARRLRGSDLPLKSLEPLNSLTKAHARLNRRNIGYPEDALVAFYLCEMTLKPILDLPSPPEDFQEFQEWLNTNVFKDWENLN